MTSIQNFTTADRLEIKASKPRTTDWGTPMPALVSLVSEAGALRFHFAMTTEQARQMAIALLAAADDVAPLKVAEAA